MAATALHLLDLLGFPVSICVVGSVQPVIPHENGCVVARVVLVVVIMEIGPSVEWQPVIYAPWEIVARVALDGLETPAEQIDP